MRTSVLLAVLLIWPLMNPAAEGSVITVDDKTVPVGGGSFTLGVKADSVGNLYAYEFHLTITPLDGQLTGTLTYVQNNAVDVILHKGGNPISTLQSADGIAVTTLNPGTPVNGLNELLADLFKFQYTAAASGRYEIGLNTATSHLVDGSVRPIAYTVGTGIVTVPEPATIFLFGLGLAYIYLAARAPANPSPNCFCVTPSGRRLQ